MQASTSPVDMLTLMALAGYTNRTRFRKTVLQPLIDADLMELTIPDKPRSSKQRYRLTELGQGTIIRLPPFSFSSSVAAVFGDTMLIGSVFDERVLLCKLRQ